jgi:hypothetical protein
MCTGDEISGIIQIGVAAVGTVAAYQEGKAEEKGDQFARNIALEQAQASRAKAQYDADVEREEARRRLSAQNAKFAKSGVDLTGTPLMVMAEQARFSEKDIQSILYTGEIEATNYERQAALHAQRGKQARRASEYTAGATLLSGAATAYKTFG